MEAHPFHVTRDAEVAIQELESDDLLETIEEAVWRRRFRAVVRLQVDTRIPRHRQDPDEQLERAAAATSIASTARWI